MDGYTKRSTVVSGTPAYQYHCMDCDFILVTVAASDLTPGDGAALVYHRSTHPWTVDTPA